VVEVEVGELQLTVVMVFSMGVLAALVVTTEALPEQVGLAGTPME